MSVGDIRPAPSVAEQPTAPLRLRGPLGFLGHVGARRRALRARFDCRSQFERLEETCIPSYMHANLFAAAVAWHRLYRAAGLYRRHAKPGPVLDFGSGSGEFAGLLPRHVPYEFVEIDEWMAGSVAAEHPGATRRRLDDLPRAYYSAVFALDALEHNEDVGTILGSLADALAADGCLILSGPTENALYRLGRKIAGFSGEYHKVTIYDIEAAAGRRFALLSRTFAPLGVPLFALSAWRLRR